MRSTDDGATSDLARADDHDHDLLLHGSGVAALIGAPVVLPITKVR